MSIIGAIREDEKTRKYLYFIEIVDTGDKSVCYDVNPFCKSCGWVGKSKDLLAIPVDPNDLDNTGTRALCPSCKGEEIGFKRGRKRSESVKDLRYIG